MLEQEKKMEMDGQKDEAPMREETHTNSSKRHHRHHHSHHHSHHGHHSHHHSSDKKTSRKQSFKRFLRKNTKEIVFASIVLLLLVCLIHSAISRGGSPDVDGNDTSGTPSAPSAPQNTGTTNDTYRFSKVDSVCDRYSNQAGTVALPKDKDGRYIDPVNNIYALYDSLVKAYPEYVTKTLMGTVLPDTEALPIYRYDFKPPVLQGSKMGDVCKILYCSGTHGGEIPPVLQGYRFFKDLCDNWRNQELLHDLRFNCHFTVIPLVNPYGIKHDQKTNENGVNLNRNFTKDWIYVADDGTTASTYSGESPASELATQLIEAMIANERFDFGLDHHTFDTFANAGHAGYFVANDAARPQDGAFADMVGTWISAKVVTNNPRVTDLSKSYFKTTAGSRFNGYMYGAFPAGYCIETVFSWGDAAMEKAYECQKFGAEVLGAIFHSAFVGYHTY